MSNPVQLTCDAVVFDCDGVLVYSRPAVEEAWRAVCVEFGLDPGAVLPGIHGVRSIDTLRSWLPDGAAARAERRLEDLEVETAGRATEIPGASVLTASLPPTRWGVATSGARRLAVARLQATRIPLPAVLVGAEDVRAGKPAPDPYLEAAARLGVDADRVVVFEDTAAGAEAARAAGARVVAVTTTYPAGSFPSDTEVADLTRVSWSAGDPLLLTIGSA